MTQIISEEIIDLVFMRMKEELNGREAVIDDNREIGLGICFGSGIGIVMGAVFDNVVLGLSAGGVLGVLIGIMVQFLKKVKQRTDERV